MISHLDDRLAQLPRICPGPADRRRIRRCFDRAGRAARPRSHARGGLRRRSSRLALQPLLHDLHVQQAEEAAAEAEAERRRRSPARSEGGVVQAAASRARRAGRRSRRCLAG